MKNQMLKNIKFHGISLFFDEGLKTGINRQSCNFVIFIEDYSMLIVNQ